MSDELPNKTPRREATPSTKLHLKGTVDPEVPMLPDHTVYHLACTAAQLADKFLLVGDPGRVPYVSEWFDKDSIEFDGMHREIRIITGKYKGVRISCVSTGMGTDNCEIVLNEIHTLKEYNVDTNEWLEGAARPVMQLIRVGTCGCPQPDVAVGTLAVTRHAIGMDNTCLFYNRPEPTPGEKALQTELAKTTLGKVTQPYTSHAHPDITAAIVDQIAALNKSRTAAEARPHVVGTTASGSGFYGCQGRAVGQFRGRLSVPHLVDELGAIRFNPNGASGKAEQERVVNIEMENSAICTLSNILGYQAGTVCAIIAKRAGEVREFATPDLVKATLKDGITVALEALIHM